MKVGSLSVCWLAHRCRGTCHCQWAPQLEQPTRPCECCWSAGSERAKRTKAVGQRLQEGININKGLLVG